MTTMYRVRATLAYGQGGPGLSQFFFQSATPGGLSADATTVAGRVRAYWAALAGQLSTSFVISVQSNVDLIEDTTGDLIGGFAITPPATVTGSGGSGFNAPGQVALGHRWTTGIVINNRKIQGRSFIGPLVSGVTNFQTPQAAAVTASAAAFTALLTATPPSATAPAVVWHRPKAPSPGAGIPITAGTLDPNKFFTINRRRD